MTTNKLILFAALVSSALACGAFADDWKTSGKNPQRNGQSADFGPDSPTLAWSGGRYSMNAWPAFIEGQRLFTIRQQTWPGESHNDAFLVAMNIHTGAELWVRAVPPYPGGWVPWIAGVNDGKVYVSRGGASFAPLYAYSAETGQILWTSEEDIDARPYDGVVFAPNGDLIIGSFTDLWRISGEDGATVWHSSRICSAAGNCGAALYGDAVYIADLASGGHAIVRYDLATGALQYTGDTMPGLVMQNTPFCGPDGTIYLSRTQNNPSYDYFYAFTDTGSAITQKWSVPAAWTVASEFGIGPDGSIYMLKPGYEFVRLNPADGSVINSAGYIPSPDIFIARMAIDAAGRVYLGNGSYEDGRLYAFDADLTLLWQTSVTDIYIGGPALGAGGTLIVCGVDTDIRAYRTARGDMNCDGKMNTFDIDPFVLALTDAEAYLEMYSSCNIMYADMNADGAVNAFDIDPFVDALTSD